MNEKIYVFAVGSVVIGTILGEETEEIKYLGPQGSVRYVVKFGTDVKLGDIVSGAEEEPIFTRP